MAETTATNFDQFDKGDTGFMLVCTSLVMLMTPGLAFFYGGLVSKKSVLAIMIQSFISLALTDIIWFCYGYSLAFGDTVGGLGIIGNLDKAFFIGISPWSPSAVNPRIPEIVFVAYQMMFAIITPALITGAFINRVQFRAYLIFLIFWLTFVYIPWVHWVWGGGFLAQWGVLDFAGGIVVHATAGMGALASVFALGARKKVVNEPHNLPLVRVCLSVLLVIAALTENFVWFLLLAFLFSVFCFRGCLDVRSLSCLFALCCHFCSFFNYFILSYLPTNINFWYKKNSVGCYWHWFAVVRMVWVQCGLKLRCRRR